MSTSAAGPAGTFRRRLGIDFVVLHADGSERTGAMLAEALTSGAADFELVRRFGDDYLFKVRTLH